MEFQDVVRRRKMVRTFERRALEPAVVERILANAQKAPSAGFSQGWAFLVLNGEVETERYWQAIGPRDRAAFPWPGLFDAPLLVVCFSHKAAYLDRYAEPDKGWTDRDEAHWPVPFWDIDTGMAAMLMLLTAVNAGLGALFFGVPDAASLRQAFAVPAAYQPIGTVAVGYPAPDDRPSGSLARGRRPGTAVVHRGRW